MQHIKSVKKIANVYAIKKSGRGYKMENMPTVKLTNGIIVGNFSSPHTFEFADGTILPACSKERAEKLKMNFTENYVESPSKMWKDIKPQIELTDEIYKELNFITDRLDYGKPVVGGDPLYEFSVHVILIPLMMISALKEETRSKYCPSFINSLNLRVMKAISRTDKRLRIDEFCV